MSIEHADISSKDRLDALIRLRKRRATLLRTHPGWILTIADTRIQIDALERLLTLDLPKGESHD